MPVRWTAPEGMTQGLFSYASDVWAYGITCVEVMQDGITPYPTVSSNPALMQLVQNGGYHEQPLACDDVAYRQLRRCWKFEPSERPSFERMYQAFLPRYFFFFTTFPFI